MARTTSFAFKDGSGSADPSTTTEQSQDEQQDTARPTGYGRPAPISATGDDPHSYGYEPSPSPSRRTTTSRDSGTTSQSKGSTSSTTTATAGGETGSDSGDAGTPQAAPRSSAHQSLRDALDTLKRDTAGSTGGSTSGPAARGGPEPTSGGAVSPTGDTGAMASGDGPAAQLRRAMGKQKQTRPTPDSGPDYAKFQGAESSGSGFIGEQAREIEQQVIENDPNVTERWQVAVDRTARGGWDVQLTEAGARAYGASQLSSEYDVAVDWTDVDVGGGQLSVTGESAQSVRRARERRFNERTNYAMEKAASLQITPGSATEDAATSTSAERSGDGDMSRAEQRAEVTRFGTRQLGEYRASEEIPGSTQYNQYRGYAEVYQNRGSRSYRGVPHGAYGGVDASKADFSQGLSPGEAYAGLIETRDQAMASLAYDTLGLATPEEARQGTASRTLADYPAIQEAEEGSFTRGFMENYASLDIWSRNVIDSAVDVAFQDSEPIAAAVGLRGERVEDTRNLSGPGIQHVGPGQRNIVPGERGNLNTEITDELTQGEGWLSDEQERKLQEDAKVRQEYFGVGAETEQLAMDITGNRQAAEFMGGVGSVPGQLFAASAQITRAVDVATEVAPNVPGAVEKYGAEETGYAMLESGGRATEQVAAQAEQNPERFVGQFIGELAATGGTSRLLSTVSRRTTSPVRWETAEAPDASNPRGTTTYRGIVTERPGPRSSPSPRFGFARGRPTVGTPSVRLRGPDMDADTSGVAPQTGLETAIWDVNLRRQLEGENLARYEAARQLRQLGELPTGRRVSRRIPRDRTTDATLEEGIRASRQIPDDAAPEVADWMRENDAAFGGSAAQLMQTGRSRLPDDIDVYVDNPRQAQGELFRILEKYEGRPMRRGRAGGIEVKQADGSWDHMVDINARERGTAGQKAWAGQLYEPDRAAAGGAIQPLESQLSAKLEGGVRLFGEGTIGPKTWRAKDVYDVEAVAQGLIGRNRRSWNPFAWRRARRSESALEQWREAWGSLDLPEEQYGGWGEFQSDFETAMMRDIGPTSRLGRVTGQFDFDLDSSVGQRVYNEAKAFAADERASVSLAGTDRRGGRDLKRRHLDETEARRGPRDVDVERRGYGDGRRQDAESRQTTDRRDGYRSGRREYDDRRPRDYGDGTQRDYYGRTERRYEENRITGGAVGASYEDGRTYPERDEQRTYSGGGTQEYTGGGGYTGGGQPPSYPPPTTYTPPGYSVTVPGDVPYQYTPTPYTPGDYPGGGGGGGGYGGGGGATPPWRPGGGGNPERIRREDEEQERQNRIGYYGHGWVNPVADAQQAIDRLGGVGVTAQSVVRRDLETVFR